MSGRIVAFGGVFLAGCMVMHALFYKPGPVFATKVAAPISTGLSATLSWPAGGEAAIGAEGYGVLAAHDTGRQTPTASTAKVLTALMVLKKHPLKLGRQGPVLTMTQADVGYYQTFAAEDGSLVKVVAGEQITEYQALEAMLLPSANNMAESLAVWSYGSMDAYTAQANSYAASLGMSHSYFADASGFSPQTVSTPSDLVRLGLAALHDPVLAQIVDQPSAVVPVAGTVRNVNWLLGSHGINGIKTGNTNQAGGVYLFSAPHTYANGQTVTIVGAVMDASSLSAAMDGAVPLLASAQANFKLATIIKSGQVLGQYRGPWAGTINAVAAGSLTQIAWQGGRPPSPRVTLGKLTVPSASGTAVGSATAGSSGRSIKIITEKPVASPGWVWRFAHIL